jgi:hypothetical protein
MNPVTGAVAKLKARAEPIYLQFGKGCRRISTRLSYTKFGTPSSSN